MFLDLGVDPIEQAADDWFGLLLPSRPFGFSRQSFIPNLCHGNKYPSLPIAVELIAVIDSSDVLRTH